MRQKDVVKLKVLNRLITIILVLICAVAAFDLLWFYGERGVDKSIFRLVLFAAVILGFAYVLLFYSKKIGENDLATAIVAEKKRLELIRRRVNYIAPFVLFAMLYHFMYEGKVIISVLVALLLLERINELRNTLK